MYLYLCAGGRGLPHLLCAGKIVELSPAEIESGEVRIPLADAGFTTYVCTRIVLQVNGETYTAYGKGCLCGALQAVTDKTLDQLAR